MAFQGLDLSKLLQGAGMPANFGGSTGTGALPTGSTQANVNPNMAPPANFWEGDTFKIGAPGLQSVQPGEQAPQVPTQPAPSQPAPQQQQAFNPTLYAHSNPDVMEYWTANQKALSGRFKTPEDYYTYHRNTFGVNENRPDVGVMGGGASANPFLQSLAAGKSSPVASQLSTNPFLQSYRSTF